MIIGIVSVYGPIEIGAVSKTHYKIEFHDEKGNNHEDAYYNLGIEKNLSMKQYNSWQDAAIFANELSNEIRVPLCPICVTGR